MHDLPIVISGERVGVQPQEGYGGSCSTAAAEVLRLYDCGGRTATSYSRLELFLLWPWLGSERRV